MLRNAGRRLDPRVRRTRELLRRALLELLQERDFRSIAVQDIAERATVNRATFYAHFRGKRELAEHTIREGFTRGVERWLPDGGGLDEESLGRLIRATCEYLGQLHGSGCSWASAQFESHVQAQVLGILQGLVTRWLRAPSLAGRARVSPETAAGAVSWSIYGGVLGWLRGGRSPSAELFAPQLVRLVSASLREAVGAPLP